MAEQRKLSAISKAWSSKDKEDFSRGMSKSGSLLPAAKPKVPVDNIPEGEMAGIDRGIAEMQESNKKKPGLQDKLNAVAKARAKFYGEE